MAEDKVITEAYLRDRFQRNQPETFTPGEGQILTPSARQFLRARRVRLVEGGGPGGGLGTGLGVGLGAGLGQQLRENTPPGRFVGHDDGRVYAEKPEYLTHLRGNRLVAKDHPRIVFRGKLDRFLADLLLVERQFRDAGDTASAEALATIVEQVRDLIQADARDERPRQRLFLGHDEQEIRNLSHYPQKYFGVGHLEPAVGMSASALGLNRLRTLVRDLEIAAVKAFPDGSSEANPDMVQILNRLSSALYVQMLKAETGRETDQAKAEETISSIVRRVCDADRNIPVELSGRHVHLSPGDVQALFGHDLTATRELSQPGQFVARERVTLIGPDGRFENVAVLGPARGNTQIEISQADARTLGVEVPIRQSGDIGGTPGLRIATAKAEVKPEKGLIIAARHIHMTPEDAVRLRVKDGDLVNVRVGDVRSLVFEKVLVRVNKNYRLSMHLDYDEGNACGWTPNTVACLLL